MQQVLKDKDAHPLLYAISGLYTGKDIAGANDRIHEALEVVAGKDKTMTAKEASAGSVKWCMRGWLRIYYLFNDESTFFPGRLQLHVQKKMEEMFFLYGCAKSTVKRADLRFVWFIQGSENHDMMDLSSAYLALQAVQDRKVYKDRKLPDGYTPSEHVKAWDAYYAQYALERAKNGLFVEISPTYGKWFVGEFVNMFEFSKSPLVRKRMEMLLHLMWADWSIDQLNGVRGGGKTRCYQGDYSQSGGSDSWDLMAQNLMGMKGWFWKTHGIFSTMALATSRYELPDVVLDLALNRSELKAFVYVSTRPAKTIKAPKHPLHEKGYWMDGSGGKIVRYSYCTPETIMGSWMLDTRTDYAAINTQNRWQGVILSTAPTMRVFPQSVGLGNGKTYNQHVAVQHRNAMLVMNHPKAKQTGQMRVFFPMACKDRLLQKKGWVIIKEAGAWLGVKVLETSGNAAAQNYEFKDDRPEKGNPRGFWLWPKSDKPPIAFVVSRVGIHRDLEEFIKYLDKHEHGVKNECAFYSFIDDLGEKIRLDLGGEYPIPLVNGKPVDLQPKKVFDSPFMRSIHGSGIIDIGKGDRDLRLNFGKAVVTD